MNIKDLLNYDEVKSNKLFINSSAATAILLPFIFYLFYSHLVATNQFFAEMNIGLIYLIELISIVLILSVFYIFYLNIFKYLLRHFKNDN